MDEWIGGWMDGWMDGWVDGWMDRQMDKQTDGEIHPSIYKVLAVMDIHTSVLVVPKMYIITNLVL